MQTFDEQRIAHIKDLLEVKQKVVIVAHKSPDGDSIGSSVGLYHYLQKKGVEVTICHPDPAPYFLQWMNGTETILNAEEQRELTFQKIKEATILFCLDFNTLNRTGILEQALMEASATKIMIDHHLYPGHGFDYTFSEVASCSTAQLITDFIHAMGDDELLDENIGNALYCGIMTDSGSFRFPSVTSHTHIVIARLMEHGVKPHMIHEAVYDTNSFEKLQLWAFAIDQKTEVLEKHKTILITLSQNELEKYHYTKGDTEGLVNEGLSITGIKKSIFLMEQDGIIKISFRSKGEDNPVNTMASKYFQGGGHLNAAGGKWVGSMDAAIAKIKDVLPEFD
ncbi:MAG: DHH family phosphoesterase [Brumimicrobium sp.]|nr:DHH family phosphoesterase [Brumimicrobium sp.]